MILVLSGRYQGEEEFAKNHFRGRSISEKNVSGFSYELSDDIDKAAYDLAEEVLSQGEDIILCHIMGCGVVPVDERQRFHAELVGRVSCILAQKAEEVWLVRAGIGTRIK